MMTSMVVTIDDILDQLWSENKRLLKELLFANKCLNILDKLKSELNLIYKKFETQLNTEDKFNQLRHQLNYICDQRRDKNFNQLTDLWPQNGIQLIDKVYEEDSHVVDIKTEDISDSREQLFSPSIGLCNSDDIKTEDNQTFGDNYHKVVEKVVYESLTSTTTTTTTAKRHKCPENGCQKSFKYFKSLVKHQSRCKGNVTTDVGNNGHQFSTNETSTTTTTISDDKLLTQNSIDVTALDEKPIACLYTDCLFRCQTDADLRQHLAVCHLADDEDKPFVCDHIGCHRAFKSEPSLLRHKCSHKNVAKIVCKFDDCNQRFKTQLALKVHSAKHKQNSGKKSRTQKANQSGRHNRIAADNSAPKAKKQSVGGPKKRIRKFDKICDFADCDKAYQLYCDLKNHQMAIHGKKFNNSIKCDYDGCDFECFGTSRLKQHERKHSVERQFICTHDDCRRALKTKQALDMHLRTHIDTGVVVCDVCHRPFKDPRSLKRHIAQHKSEPTLRCPVKRCTEKFYTNSEIVKHRIDVHNYKRVYNRVQVGCDWPGCEWIGIHFKLHRSTHTGVKPFACHWPQCNKRFRLATFLKDHLNIHNNLKPHACRWPGCEYRSANNANMIKHMKQVHQKAVQP